jgi:hypothetical protein
MITFTGGRRDGFKGTSADLMREPLYKSISFHSDCCFFFDLDAEEYVYRRAPGTLDYTFVPPDAGVPAIVCTPNNPLNERQYANV